jgi:phytoene desaturase
MKRSAVVVGAGLGGLASAARLARAGFEVRVFEKELEPGGRCGRLVDGAFVWDIGPTILLFPQVLRDHFNACGERIEASLTMTPCDPNYRIHFGDGSELTMSANLREMQAELERLAPGSFSGFVAFLEQAKGAKEIAFSTFLARTFDGPRSMMRPDALLGVLKSRSYKSLYSVVSGLVADERVRMALTFQTMYLGLSPFEGPALFGLLPYTEIVDGIWHTAGGLSSISRALAGLAVRCGANIAYGRGVRRIDVDASGTRARGVTLEDGERVEADVVLVNADLPYAYRELLGRPLRRGKKFTSSGFMLFLGCDRTWDSVLHHNVLFGKNYRASFDDLFVRGRVPDDPSFYVAHPARNDESMAPVGKSAIYVLMPVPHLPIKGGAGPDWNDGGTRKKLRDHVIARLERTIAPGIERAIEVEHTMTPLDWRKRFSLEHGSAFGLSHTLDQVGGMRPPNRDPETSNLYFVGASTQPATGIPNVLIGAELVSRRIAKEQLS